VSCHDIERVRLSEIRFPSDLVHNGRSYLRGVRSDSLSLMCATRRVRGIRINAEKGAAIKPQTLRIHRVEAPRGVLGPSRPPAREGAFVAISSQPASFEPGLPVNLR
jgi:hypothetical protein